MSDASETDDKVNATYQAASPAPPAPVQVRTDSTPARVRTVVVTGKSRRIVLRYAPHATRVPPTETSGD